MLELVYGTLYIIDWILLIVPRLTDDTLSTSRVIKKKVSGLIAIVLIYLLSIFVHF